MIEDGGIFYNSQYIPGAVKGSRLRLMIGEAVFGSAWRAVKTNGIGALVEEIHLSKPELVRKEWNAIKTVELSPDPVLQIADTDLPRTYLDVAGCRIEDLKEVQLFVVLAKSTGLGGDLGRYVDVVNEMLRIAGQENLKIAVKYHPKEENDDYMMLGDKSGISVLPKQLPGELLFIVNREKLKFVLGDSSSALLSLPWLLPQCKAISFVHMVNKQPHFVPPDLAAFGIHLVHSAADFEDMLCKRGRGGLA